MTITMTYNLSRHLTNQIYNISYKAVKKVNDKETIENNSFLRYCRPTKCERLY